MNKHLVLDMCCYIITTARLLRRPIDRLENAAYNRAFNIISAANNGVIRGNDLDLIAITDAAISVRIGRKKMSKARHTAILVGPAVTDTGRGVMSRLFESPSSYPVKE